MHYTLKLKFVATETNVTFCNIPKIDLPIIIKVVSDMVEKFGTADIVLIKELE